MSESLVSLEQQRNTLLEQISALGDFRPGSISGTGGRCGSPTCHCHRPNDPGHDPHLRLTYKVDGKSVTESFATPAAQRKAETEIAAFRQYQEWNRSFVAVNEQICRARPVADTLTPQEKNGRKHPARSRAQGSEPIVAGGFWRVWRKTGQIDLEAVETACWSAPSMHRAGATALQQLLCMPCAAHGQTVPFPAAGKSPRFHENRRKQVITMVGPVISERAYYLCPACHQGQSPCDRELDVVGTEFSPGVGRMMAAVGSEASFESGRAQLQLLAGLEITAKAVERHAEAIGGDISRREQDRMKRVVQLEFPGILGSAVPIMYLELDGTQVPMVRGELEGRAGRIEGQPARTREVKLGCVQSGMFWTVRGANAVIALRCTKLSGKFEDY